MSLRLSLMLESTFTDSVITHSLRHWFVSRKQLKKFKNKYFIAQYFKKSDNFGVRNRCRHHQWLQPTDGWCGSRVLIASVLFWFWVVPARQLSIAVPVWVLLGVECVLFYSFYCSPNCTITEFDAFLGGPEASIRHLSSCQANHIVTGDFNDHADGGLATDDIRGSLLSDFTST